MGIDKDKLTGLFAEGAKVGQAAKEAENAPPTLKGIWALVADKFAADKSFQVRDVPGQGHDMISINVGDSGPSLQISDNGDGTFCLNSNGKEMFNKTPPEQTIKQIGAFYGRHSR